MITINFQTIFRFALFSFACFGFFSCQESQTEKESIADKSSFTKTKASSIKFTLLPAEKTGIDFENTLKPNLLTRANLFKYTYFYNGGGVAIGDLNNDGLPEVFMSGNQVPNKLYLNEGDFKFKDIAQFSNINALNRWSTGVTMADVNQDGLLDIYICNSGPTDQSAARKNELYINNGGLKFTESAEQYGIADNRYSTQASFFDYDKDGDLDLIVMNHSYWAFGSTGEAIYELKKNPELTESMSPQLYENMGNNTFANVSKKAGIDHYSFGLGLATSDINQDGNVDAYITNDFSVPDYFFGNKGDGTFAEILKNFTRQISWFGMGCDVTDVNNDALPDIAVVDMTSSDHIRSKTLMPSMSTEDFWTTIESWGYQYQYMFNSLQINNGNRSFSNVANLTGIHQTDWSWATLFADFDNDGDKDNFISNGYRKYNSDNDFNNRYEASIEKHESNVPYKEWQELYEQMPEQKLSNLLYRNDGDLHFEESGADWGLAKASYSNGAAYGDLDNDGDLDLVVNNIDDPAFVYRNDLGKENNYLQIVLQGSKKGENTFNTKVTLEYAGQKQYQDFSTVRGYQSSMEPLVHFGLGEHKVVDEIRLVWPTGEEQVLKNVEANQRLTIVKKPNSAGPRTKPQERTFVTRKTVKIFDHMENKYNDFDKEVLLPHKQSTLGPFISTGDVNGDGFEDIFTGGAKGQSGELTLMSDEGFRKASSQPWSADKACEDMGSCFFDADQDGDLDLYVVSGGNEVPASSPLLQDRLYINDGKGNFKKSNLPQLRSSGQRVKAIDFDGDNDLDLLVGGRAIPQKYPYPDRTFLLENDKGQFRDVTEEKAVDLMNPGIVTDFVWTDFNGDEKPDLLVVGEWMPVQFYENTGKGFSKSKERNDLRGWWYSVAAGDLDNDGDTDYVLGNIGKNNKFQAKAKKPLYVYCNDFDDNGSFDIVLSKTYKGKKVPTRGRQCSSQQMPFITDKFTDYNAFANASIQDLYGEENLSEGLQLEANEMQSVILWNEGGTYTPKALPVMAQIAPINGIVLEDINNDQLLDIVTAGNMFHTEVETQRYDAGQGALLLNKGGRNFEFQTSSRSGLMAPLDAKDVKLIKGGGKKGLLVANNNGPVMYFSINHFQ